MKREILKAVPALTGLGTLCVLVSLGSMARACSTEITWQADLTAPSTAPVSPDMTPAAGPSQGKATVEFDFIHPGATFRVETKNPGAVQQITLHVIRTFSAQTGPTLFTLYDAASGPLPAVYTKRVGEADLQKQPSIKIVTLTDAVHAVLDGRAYVTVTPKTPSNIPSKTADSVAALPQLTGFITMHKEEIYSDQPGDIAHDPALHHAAPSTAAPLKN